MKVLESNGVTIDGINVKGILINVCHDNLGGNCCFGFVQSFSANFFCRICTMPKTETETSTSQNEKYLRTPESYDNLFRNDKSKTFVDFSMSQGIKVTVF